MSLGSRIGFVFSNLVLLIPVFLLLLVTAILSSYGASKLSSISSASKAYHYVTGSTVALWILFAGTLIFAFTFGLWFIPWIIYIPYLYGGIMIIFALINLAIAGIMFYAANEARISDEYKKGSKDAKHAFTSLLVCGLLMTLAAIFMIIYSVYSVHKYRQGGGVIGDVAIVGEYGGTLLTAAGVPEVGVPLQAVGGLAKGSQTKATASAPAQQTQAPTAQAPKKTAADRAAALGALAGHVKKATGEAGTDWASLAKNPEAYQAALGLI